MSAGTSMSGGGGAASVAGATSSGSLGFIYGGRLPPRPPANYILNQLGLVDPNTLKEGEVVIEISDKKKENEKVNTMVKTTNEEDQTNTNRQLLCICIVLSTLVLGIVITIAVIISQL